DSTTADWIYTYTIDYATTLTAPGAGSSTVACVAIAVGPGASSGVTGAGVNTSDPVLVGTGGVSTPDPITCDGTVVWTYRYTACRSEERRVGYECRFGWAPRLSERGAGTSTVACVASAVEPGVPADSRGACRERSRA